MSGYATDQGHRILECLSSIIGLLSDRELSLYGIVQDNDECRKDKGELERLHAALQTYLKTDVDLRYIAFIGAFSSGKTATINSLLRLSGDEKRPEDTNPVDERLTICAHENRRASVITALLKSAWNHEKFFHNAAELLDVILVDTPGAGDPKIQTDIVYNFLPICDTIVYFFNATNPLNNNDLPILRELNQALDHTDFFYVYTRADNVFKLDDDAPFTEENFDSTKASRQKDVFTARLTAALAGISIRGIELFFVSNAKVKYGIDDLRKRILLARDDSTTLALKKLDFFRLKSKDWLDHMLSTLRELRETVGELVSKAEQNHLMYNQKFDIRTEEIRDFWRSAQDIIKSTSGHFKELKTEDIIKPISMAALQEAAMKELDAHRKVISESKELIQELSGDLARDARHGFEHWTNGIRDILRTNGLQATTQPGTREQLTGSLKTSIYTTTLKRSLHDKVSGFAWRLTTQIQSQVLKDVSERARSIRSDLERAMRHSAEGELFNNERDLRAGCRKEIGSAIELHASLIDLYVAGINTEGTMMLIRKADLGKDIDFLQKEKIGDDEKRETIEHLMEEIFGSEHQRISAIEQRCKLIPQEIRTTIGEVTATIGEVRNAVDDVQKIMQSELPAVDLVDWDLLISELVKQFDVFQEGTRERYLRSLNSILDAAKERIDNERSAVISAWRRRLWGILLIGMAVISVAWSITYRFGIVSANQSWGEAILLGAGGNAIWACAVLLYRAFNSSTSDWIAKSQKVIFEEATKQALTRSYEWKIEFPSEIDAIEATCSKDLAENISVVLSKNSKSSQGSTTKSYVEF